MAQGDLERALANLTATHAAIREAAASGLTTSPGTGTPGNTAGPATGQAGGSNGVPAGR